MSAEPGPGSTTTNADAAAPRDFRRLRESGERAGIGARIGASIASARDDVARFLIRLGATPNRVTITGFLLTCGAGWCLTRGAGHQAPFFHTAPGPTSYWPLAAFIFLFLASAADMLDGSIARIANLRSRFGGILDSCLDRFSDMAIYIGCAIYFALLGNVTYTLLAIFSLCNGFLISYVKARAETVIDDCSVGFWMRGERSSALLFGTFTGHIPAVLWQLAILNFLTVLRRIDYSRRCVAALEAGRPMPPRGPEPGWIGRFQLWRHPRGSIPCDIVTGLNIAYIILGPTIFPALLAVGANADALRAWLSS